MASSMRALGAQLRKKVCAAEMLPQFSMCSKQSFLNGTGTWTPLNITPATMFNMIAKRSFSNRTGIWPSLKNTHAMNMVKGKGLSFRLTARTKCNLGSSRAIMTNGKNQGNNPKVVVRPISTHEQLSSHMVHTGSTPRYMKGKALLEMIVLRWWDKLWKSLEDDFIKGLGQGVGTVVMISFTWFAYNVMSTLGLDTRILDKIRGYERSQSEENKMAIKILSDILERKDMRLKLVEEEKRKMREESQRAREAQEKEVGKLKEEVRVLKASIHALEEQKDD